MIGDPNIGPPIGNPRNPIEILGILGLQRRSLGGPRGGEQAAPACHWARPRGPNGAGGSQWQATHYSSGPRGGLPRNYEGSPRELRRKSQDLQSFSLLTTISQDLLFYYQGFPNSSQDFHQDSIIDFDLDSDSIRFWSPGHHNQV